MGHAQRGVLERGGDREEGSSSSARWEATKGDSAMGAGGRSTKTGRRQEEKKSVGPVPWEACAKGTAAAACVPIQRRTNMPLQPQRTMAEAQLRPAPKPAMASTWPGWMSPRRTASSSALILLGVGGDRQGSAALRWSTAGGLRTGAASACTGATHVAAGLSSAAQGTRQRY